MALLSSASVARAGDCDSRLLSTCIDSDTLWPHAGPQRFVAVGGTETVPRSNVSFGLVASYQSRPIVVHLPSPGPAGSDRTVIDNQLSSTFLFGYGVTDRLELDLALPITLLQDGSGASLITGGANDTPQGSRFVPTIGAWSTPFGITQRTARLSPPPCSFISADT